jgi:hypothetical protein
MSSGAVNEMNSNEEPASVETCAKMEESFFSHRETLAKAAARVMGRASSGAFKHTSQVR